MKRAGWQDYKHRVQVREASYQVGTMTFNSAAHAYHFAQTKGYSGGLTTIANRLKAGVKTIDELIANPANRGSAASQKERHKREKEEMAKLMAEIDARKKSLPDSQ